jgi:hypothetical protein
MKYLKKFDKKIKGFKQFMSLIKESKSFWSEDITEDDFYDYLRDLVDENFEITVEKGFVECINLPKKEEGDPNQLKLFPTDELEVDDDLIGVADSYKDDYDFFVYPGSICPSYKIHIEESDSSEGNFTEALLFFRRIVLSELGFQTAILVDYEVIDFKYIKVEDGQFHIREYDDEELGYNTYDSIDLIVMSTKPIEFKIKDVADYYGWKNYEIGKDGNLYFKVDLDDMAHLVCSDSNQESIITDGIMDDDYNQGYYPDADSLVRYYLTSDAEKMLAKCIIMEFGGVESIDELKGMTEEGAIEFLTSENYRRTLVKLAEDSSICDDLRGLYSQYSSDAQLTANYNALFNEFEEVVDKHFTYKYDPEEREYTIQFDSEWMSSLVSDHEEEANFFRNYNPDGIMQEWFSRNDHPEELSPRYSEGDVNTNKFSAEAIGQMEYYLDRKNKENSAN